MLSAPIFVHDAASASVICRDALVVLQRELPYSSWHAPQVLYDSLHTCEICTRCFPDCTPCTRMQCLVGLLPGTLVSLTRCGKPSARPVTSSSWSSGARGLAPPGLVCDLACRGSASHVSPESLYVTQRFVSWTQSRFLHELLVQFLR